MIHISAIGDYIHYTSKGYAKYGIAKFRETPQKEVDIFNAFKTKFLQKIQEEANQAMTKSERIQLQKNLSQILDSNVDRSDENNIIAQIQNELVHLVEQQAQRGKNNAIVDFSTGNVTLQQAQSIALIKKEQVLSQIDTSLKKVSIYKSTIESRIAHINKLIGSIKFNTDKITVQQKIAQIETNYQMIKQNVQNLRGTNQLYFTEDVKNLVSDINNLLVAFDATAMNNLIKGDFMEYAVALSPLVGMNLAQEEARKQIKQLEATKVGTDRSTVKINTDLFSEQIDFNKLAIQNRGWTYNQNNKLFTTILPTQEKIDVNLSWQGRTIPASIKNVNLFSGYDVHLVSNTSLLYLIQDMDTNFVNHYLNVVATHNESSSMDGYISSQMYHSAQQVMKLLILYKAISGKTYGRQSASIFIVNDNSKSGIESIKIYDIPSLIVEASNNLTAFTTITANGVDLAFMRINNPWSKDYSTRITRVIQNVHNQKISAALKPSIFNLTI